MSITPHAGIVPVIRYPVAPPPPQNTLEKDVTEPYPRVAQGTASMIPEDHLYHRGFPRVPTIWCNAEAVVTSDGSYYGERPSLEEAQEDSYISFVAGDDDWDVPTLTWMPQRDSSPVLYRMEGVHGAVEPMLDWVEYHNGRERFTARAISLFDEAPLVSDFNSNFDDANNFVMGMALNFRAASEEPIIKFGDDSTIKHGGKTGFSCVISGNRLDVPMPTSTVTVAPIYLVLAVKPPTAKLVVGFATNKLYQGSCAVPVRTTSFAFTLGSEMDVFSFDLWGDDAPNPIEIIGRYSAALGART